jgi:proteasome lid subunit RPN8/RPN11
MVITDLVYDEIDTHLASHAPERGGALYGPRRYPFVTHFEFDPDGKTSAVSYVPSSRLINNVPKVEAETGLQFKGIIHSHPHGLTRPSRGDEQTVASFFRLNPHVSDMALPIVQQVKVKSAPFLQWYRAERRSAPSASPLGMLRRPLLGPEPVVVLSEEFHVLKIGAHARAIIDHLGTRGMQMTVVPQLQHLKVQNAELVGLLVNGPQGQEFMYLVSLDYPIVAPVVLYQRQGTTRNLHANWNGMSEADVETSLHVIADNLFDEWAPAATSLVDPANQYQSSLKPGNHLCLSI